MVLAPSPVVETNLPKRSKEPSDRTFPVLFPKDLVTQCRLNSHQEAGRHTVKQDIFDKRFIVGLVNYNNFHWASYIFDRRLGQAFYYDTLGGRPLVTRQKAFACGVCFPNDIVPVLFRPVSGVPKYSGPTAETVNITSHAPCVHLSHIAS
ncbi:hypothetical protein B0J13DRAFT_630090 [Dactylonectria estremocensis]|nr:hypothetical protein B0J13DRAFT_630090 [Dactylonectria estremocensis]